MHLCVSQFSVKKKKKNQVSFIQDSSEQVDNTIEAPIDCRSNEKIDDYMLAAPIVELNSSFKRKFQLENGIVTTVEVSKEQEKFRSAKKEKTIRRKILIIVFICILIWG